MTMQRPSQKGIDRIIDRLSIIKARYANALSFQRLRNQESTQPLKALLQELKDMHERNIKALVEHGGHMTSEDRIQQIEVSKARRDTFDWFMDLIEKPEGEVASLSATISELEQDLATKRKEYEEFGVEELKEAR